ncbi:DNA polymerase [Paramuricea clavata]|uniref:DNA polymerase n=1 Tax=Paramuricea clavata TaxID=317549 RepID=A0A7D9LF78_PARCT|nr:DNA polymerase [Paramuricea clavata]
MVLRGLKKLRSSKEKFFSKLSNENISDTDYERACTVWNTFNMKTMRNYHDLYLNTDVLLLADVMENFRKVCKTNYGLDPMWYYTAPGLAWDVALKLTGVELDLISDPDMYLFIEKGIRGGISTITKSLLHRIRRYSDGCVVLGVCPLRQLLPCCPRGGTQLPITPGLAPV